MYQDVRWASDICYIQIDLKLEANVSPKCKPMIEFFSRIYHEWITIKIELFEHKKYTHLLHLYYEMIPVYKTLPFKNRTKITYCDVHVVQGWTDTS